MPVVIIRFNHFASLINDASEAGPGDLNFIFTTALALKATKPSMHADMN